MIKIDVWTNEMDWSVEGLAQPDNLSSIPGTHIMEAEKLWLQGCIVASPGAPCPTCTACRLSVCLSHTHTYTLNK